MVAGCFIPFWHENPKWWTLIWPIKNPFTYYHPPNLQTLALNKQSTPTRNNTTKIPKQKPTFDTPSPKFLTSILLPFVGTQRLYDRSTQCSALLRWRTSRESRSMPEIRTRCTVFDVCLVSSRSFFAYVPKKFHSGERKMLREKLWVQYTRGKENVQHVLGCFEDILIIKGPVALCTYGHFLVAVDAATFHHKFCSKNHLAWRSVEEVYGELDVFWTKISKIWIGLSLFPVITRIFRIWWSQAKLTHLTHLPLLRRGTPLVNKPSIRPHFLGGK